MGRLRLLQAMANELTVSVRSDDELVEVQATGTGEIRIRLHDGALRDQSAQSLEQKINRQLEEAMYQLRIAYRDVSARALDAS